MKYAVVITYSFDDEVAVYLFADEEAAKRMLRDAYENEIRMDAEENGWDVDAVIREDGWYAKITDRFPNHENVTEFHIGIIH